MQESLTRNHVDLWISDLPRLKKESNKYDRGHLIILGGTEMTGAARLASEAAMRIGCGLCTIVSSEDAKDSYLCGAPHVMFEAYRTLQDFYTHCEDPRRNACVAGPGAGKKKSKDLRHCIENVLRLKKPTVIDADALNAFQDKQADLYYFLHEDCVLTPHDGEFLRFFPHVKGTRQQRVLQAVELTGSVIVLKGTETIIGTPSGDILINDHSTPWLATAGSGDVLAGMIGGLLAAGMPIFKACAAATWIHGEVALRFGPGLTAPDLIQGTPAILNELYA